MDRQQFLQIARNRDVFREEQTRAFRLGTDEDNKKLFEAMDQIDFENFGVAVAEKLEWQRRSPFDQILQSQPSSNGWSSAEFSRVF